MCLFAAGTCKACLSLFLVVYCGMDVVAVAASTVFATLMSSSLLLYLMKNTKSAIHISFHDMKVDWGILRQILSIGTPAGVQGAVFSLSNVVIQAAINSLGAVVMAASTAAFTIEINIYVLLIAFGQAVTTFVSQNYGAGNLPRCRRVTQLGLLVTMVVTVVLSALACIFADPLLALFNDNPAVIDVGRIRIYYIIGFYFLCVFIEILSGAMRGYGHSLPPALLMLVTVCGVRITWIYTAFVAEPTFATIMISYPLSWAATVVLLVFIYLFYRRHITARKVLI